MDRDDIDDLLDDLDAQNSDLSNEVFSESSTVAGDNGKHNSLEVNMLKQRTGTPDT